MRRAFPGLVLLLLMPSSLAACAMLTGLDQITESACLPSCDGEAGAEVGAPAESGAHAEASLEASLEAGVDQSSPETAATDAATLDASLDVVRPVDSGSPEDSATMDSATVDAPPDSPCGTVYLRDSFADNALGWTLDSTWSIAATCATPPAPAKGNPDPTADHTTGASGGVLGAYACGNNPTGQTTPFRYATSPTIDVSAAPAVILSFYRWLNADRSTWMTSTVDVFDGSAWVNVYTNPSGGLLTDATWTQVSYDLTAHKSASLRVRFGYAAVNSAVYAMSSWNVDDVMVSSSTCP